MNGRSEKQHTKLVCHATLKLSSPKSRNVKKRENKSFSALTARNSKKRNASGSYGL